MVPKTSNTVFLLYWLQAQLISADLKVPTEANGLYIMVMMAMMSRNRLTILDFYTLCLNCTREQRKFSFSDNR